MDYSIKYYVGVLPQQHSIPFYLFPATGF
jgi:hypothetical protein